VVEEVQDIIIRISCIIITTTINCITTNPSMPAILNIIRRSITTRQPL
jgi:hypothetical protein